MAFAKNKRELEGFLESIVQSTLAGEVFDHVSMIHMKAIQEEVYNAYTPYNYTGTEQHYHRTYELMNPENFEAVLKGNTMTFLNKSYETFILSVIEKGGHYNWGYPTQERHRDLDSEIGARPFFKRTKEEVKKTNQIGNIIYKNLEKFGIKKK